MLFEILHIAPVGWHRLANSRRLECLSDKIAFAYAFWTEGEDVVTLPANPYTEFESADGPGLTDEGREVVEIFSGFEIKLGWIAALTQLRGLQGFNWHSKILQIGLERVPEF
jgi:hypothetical protein